MISYVGRRLFNSKSLRNQGASEFVTRPNELRHRHRNHKRRRAVSGSVMLSALHASCPSTRS